MNKKTNRGQSLLEFTVMIPILLFIVVALGEFLLFQFSRLWMDREAVQLRRCLQAIEHRPSDCEHETNLRLSAFAFLSPLTWNFSVHSQDSFDSRMQVQSQSLDLQYGVLQSSRKPGTK